MASDQEKALDALKSLEMYKYQEREVTVSDVKIVLAPLMASEVVEIFENSNRYSDSEASVQSLKIDTVARAIISVNDVKLDPKGMLKQKQEIVASFGDELIDYLFSEYCILDKVIKLSVDKRESGEVEVKGVEEKKE
jgi:hypothetical protein